MYPRRTQHRLMFLKLWGPQGESHVRLREAQLDPPLFELLGKLLQVVRGRRILVRVVVVALWPVLVLMLGRRVAVFAEVAAGVVHLIPCALHRGFDILLCAERAGGPRGSLSVGQRRDPLVCVAERVAVALQRVLALQQALRVPVRRGLLHAAGLRVHDGCAGDPLLPTGGSQALCQVDAEAHLDSAPPQTLIGCQKMMDVVTQSNDAMIGYGEISTNTTLFVGECELKAPVEAESRSATWGDGAPGAAVQLSAAVFFSYDVEGVRIFIHVLFVQSCVIKRNG
ncbi:uncharacterized protein [Channa argus]|uniref:uncharacterized protein n=1 Tax=Channa argus TaxID=215402 RepID=UPI00352130AC